MANHERIMEWAIRCQKELKLDVTQATWTEDWLPGYHDYQAIIEIGGHRFTGRGLDGDWQIAFEKAVAEAVERASVFHSEPGLHAGVAAFTDLEGAKWKAYLELLEADRAISHHHTFTPFSSLPLTILGQTTAMELSARLSSRHLTLTVHEMRATLDARCAVAFIRKAGLPALGFVCGFGADQKIEKAVEHAVLECLREGVTTLVGKERPKKELEVLKSEMDPSWHFWNAQSEDASDRLGSILRGDQSSALEAEPISFLDTKSTELSVIKQYFPDMPIWVAKVDSPALLAPQFGNYALSDHNSNRFRQFSPMAILEFDPTPHFYG